MRTFFILLGVFFVFCFSLISNVYNTKTSKEISKEVIAEKHSGNLQPVPTKISVNEQEKDDKGIAIPLSENMGVLVNDISFSQMFIHPKYNYYAYYIDLDKYPQLTGNILGYAEKLAHILSDDEKDIDIFVYPRVIDFYYMREVPQNTQDIILEMERQKPIFSVSYSPKYFLNVCVLTLQGYKSMGKSSYNHWQWEPGGSCGYEYTKTYINKSLSKIISD